MWWLVVSLFGPQIKTIGSTYMVAAGLTPGQISRKEVTVLIIWSPDLWNFLVAFVSVFLRFGQNSFAHCGELEYSIHSHIDSQGKGRKISIYIRLILKLFTLLRLQMSFLAFEQSAGFCKACSLFCTKSERDLLSAARQASWPSIADKSSKSFKITLQ